MAVTMLSETLWNTKSGKDRSWNPKLCWSVARRQISFSSHHDCPGYRREILLCWEQTTVQTKGNVPLWERMLACYIESSKCRKMLCSIGAGYNPSIFSGLLPHSEELRMVGGQVKKSSACASWQRGFWWVAIVNKNLQSWVVLRIHLVLVHIQNVKRPERMFVKNKIWVSRDSSGVQVRFLPMFLQSSEMFWKFHPQCEILDPSLPKSWIKCLKRFHFISHLSGRLFSGGCNSSLATLTILSPITLFASEKERRRKSVFGRASVGWTHSERHIWLQRVLMQSVPR